MDDHKESGMARRSFIGCLLGGSTALALEGLVTPSAALAAAMPPSKSHAGKWDEHWVASITGRHRQVFDAVSPGDESLIFALNFLNTGEEAYHLKDKDFSAVIVLRHMAIPMAFTDAIWKKYQFGKMFDLTDPHTKTPAERNFYTNRTPKEMLLPDLSINLLQKRGVIFTCCNMALTFFSGMAAEKMGMKKDVVRQEWINGLLPGVALVPSGVLAVNRAQEQRCTYCYAG